MWIRAQHIYFTFLQDDFTPLCEPDLVRDFPFSLFFLSCFTLVTGPRRSLHLQLSDTRVYEPQVLALLVTRTHFCEVVVLKLRAAPVECSSRFKHSPSGPSWRTRVPPGRFHPALRTRPCACLSPSFWEVWAFPWKGGFSRLSGGYRGFPHRFIRCVYRRSHLVRHLFLRCTVYDLSCRRIN